MATTETVWDNQSLTNPHAAADKRQRVQKMFAAIAPTYDLNNRLHSLWMDQRWRKKAVKLADLGPTDQVVDVACGTGDLALRFLRELWRSHARVTLSHAFGRSATPPPQNPLARPRVIGI